jgi:hypothetical protein
LAGVVGGTELGGVSTGGIEYVLRRLHGLKVAPRTMIDQEMNLACTIFFIFSSLEERRVGFGGACAVN